MEVRANQIYDAVSVKRLPYLILFDLLRLMIFYVLVMQVRNNYMCLVQSAANKTKKFKPIVAWMEFFDVCMPRNSNFLASLYSQDMWVPHKL